MLRILTIIPVAALIASCKPAEKGSGEPPVPRENRSDPSENRETDSPSGDLHPTSELIKRIDTAPTSKRKRQLFEEALLTAPPEEHDDLVGLVINDLTSPNPVDLLTDYLELAEMLEPEISLPGMARILEEGKVSPLQQSAMEQSLREVLGTPGKQKPESWKTLITDFLKSRSHLINNDE